MLSRVPMESKAMICISGRGRARLHKLNMPLPQEETIRCFLATYRIESRAKGIFLVINLERVGKTTTQETDSANPEKQEQERVSLEVACVASAVPILVKRREYLEISKAILQIRKFRSEEEKEQFIRKLEKKINQTYPIILALRHLEELCPKKEDVVFVAPLKQQYDKKHRGYVPFIVKLDREEFKKLVLKILELAPSETRFRKEKRTTQISYSKPDGAILILLDRVVNGKTPTDKFKPYLKLNNIIKKLELEKKAVKVLPRVYIIKDFELARQIRDIFEKVYKLNILLSRFYMEDNVGVIDHVLSNSNK